MTSTTVIPSEGGEFVELANTGKGKLFKKQILRIGESFVHPTNPTMRVSIDDQFADTLIKNFDDGVCDTVQFPLVNEKNQHVEDPDRNRGQVVGLTKENGGVYATIDVRKNADDIGSLVLGASAMMSLNYTDTISGKKVGPTLLHVAATNRPYLSKLAPYEEVALSANSDDECVVLSRVDEDSDNASGKESETDMDLTQLLDVLKSEHNIDVAELQRRADSNSGSNQELVTALSNVLRAADPDLLSLSNADDDDVSVDDVAQGVIELSRNFAELSDRLDNLSAKSAEDEIDGLIRAGRILPHQKDAMLSLSMNDRETFDALVPDHAIVALSEDGVQIHEQPGGEDYEAEVNRLLGKKASDQASA